MVPIRLGESNKISKIFFLSYNALEINLGNFRIPVPKLEEKGIKFKGKNFQSHMRLIYQTYNIHVIIQNNKKSETFCFSCVALRRKRPSWCQSLGTYSSDCFDIT